MVRAIDCWINVDMGEQEPPDYLVRVKEDYFKGGDDFFKSLDADELLADMDAAGVAKAILGTTALAPSDRVLAMCKAHPDRFDDALMRDLTERELRLPPGSDSAKVRKGEVMVSSNLGRLAYFGPLKQQTLWQRIN